VGVFKMEIEGKAEWVVVAVASPEDEGENVA
jgi:hypothetical protein